MKKIAIIIPTFNELENIEKLINSIFNNVPEITIFIVDDTNNTKLGDLINSKNLAVKYLHRENSRGRGSAVLHGLKKALDENKFDIFIEMDADFSHNPDELKKNLQEENINNFISKDEFKNLELRLSLLQVLRDIMEIVFGK